MNIYFYVAYPYYFPHFLPISRECKTKNYNVKYILSSKQNSSNMEQIAKLNGLEYSFDEEELFSNDVDFVFFANPYERINEIKAKTAFLEHGIGTKSNGFYSSIKDFDIYFVEGDQKYNTLKKLYPEYEAKLAKVGFSKFDDVINYGDDFKKEIFKKYNLDINKKTILYAPTFFPSSIEKMSDSFPNDFKDYNIIVKAHYLTFERKKYKNQIKKFDKWSKYNNCVILPLSEYSLVPFLAVSDIMISDESSAMFEFASLNKPVISNRYFKLRWSYYLFPWKLSKRIDKSKDFYRQILHAANSYKETKELTKKHIENSFELEKLRKKFAFEICGEIDGNVSKRMLNILEKKYDKK